MIDFHSHILSETDDGARDFAESVTCLYEAKKAGFSSIICTPHYIVGFYECDYSNIEEKIKKLQIAANNIDLTLYHANEIYVHDEIPSLISNKKVSTINNGKYLLMEFPLTDIPMLNSMDIIKNIVKAGYIPIIAHPERYPYVQKDINFAQNLIKNGALLQCNYSSIDNFYGIKAKKTIIKLLKNNMVSFLGSDNHRKKSIYYNMNKYISKILKYISEEEFEKISKNNALKILRNEEL